ncbi:PREDICTED: golgin subfamily A member 3 [Theobroma cacao]|uniref:FRIGIDA-like protein n=1 Tax=Theobroma cacao TaxID=3641 RepID=A0AB32V678_THECC|nr:PREDICTED: golgin subfamily A member 3 [Theobroma cacao]
MEKLTELELIKLSKMNLKKTFDKTQDQASSILLLNLQWKDMEGTLNSAQNSIEERLKEVRSREEHANKHEEEIQRREELVKDQFKEIRIKEEELGRQRRDLELEKKDYEERLRQVELKQKQFEELKLKEEEVGSKEKDLEKRLREFELKEKNFEKNCGDFELEREKRRKELECNEKQYEHKYKDVQAREKLVKGKSAALKKKRKAIGLEKEHLEKCYRELELKQEQFGLKEKSFQKRCEEFELGEKGFEQRRKEFEEQRELEYSEFNLVVKLVRKQLEDVKKKEVEIGLKEKRVEESFEKLRIANEDVRVMEKSVLDLCEEVKRKEQELGLKERNCELRFRDVDLLETCFQNGLQNLGLKLKQCEERSRELELKERLIKDQFEELNVEEEPSGSKNDQSEECSSEFKMKERCLRKGYQDLEASRKHYEECLSEIKLKEKQIEESSEQLRRKYEQQFKDLKLKENKLAEWSKELGMKERRLASAQHPQENTEPANSFPVKYPVDHSSPAHLHFCVNMDGKDLQMFLNEHLKINGSIGTEVAMALQLSSNPAKLVLDAMEGFYPPHLRKGDTEFEGKAVRGSCILLLEQLMKISPEIKPHVQKEARELAFVWITKMSKEPGHSLEVLGFLQLVASFRLADAFDADELVNFLGSVAQYRQTPELFKNLGLGDKISGFIRELVERKQHIDAIRFIYAFGLVSDFPPVPLLKEYLNHSKAAAGRILRKGKKTPEAQNESWTKRIADLRAVVKCIKRHKLESEYLPLNLKKLNALIASLEKKCVGQSLASANANAAPETPSQQQISIKRSRALLDTEIAGDASVGATATATVSKMKMPSKHLKRSNQEYKINSKLLSCLLGENMKRSNSKQLQQQDSGQKDGATTSAPAVSSPVCPAPAAPTTVADPSSTTTTSSPAIIPTTQPQEEEHRSKRPRSASFLSNAL